MSHGRRFSALKEQFDGNVFKSPEEFRLAKAEEKRRQTQAIVLARSRAARYNMTLRALTIRQQKSLRGLIDDEDDKSMNRHQKLIVETVTRQAQRDSNPELLDAGGKGNTEKMNTLKSERKSNGKSQMKIVRSPSVSSTSSTTIAEASNDELRSPHHDIEPETSLKKKKTKKKKKKKKKKKATVAFQDVPQVVEAEATIMDHSRASSLASDLGAVNDVLADVLDFDLSSNEVLSRLSYSAEETLKKRQSKHNAMNSVHNLHNEFLDELVNARGDDADTIGEDIENAENPFAGPWDEEESEVSPRQSFRRKSSSVSIERKLSRKQSVVKHLRGISFTMRRRQSVRKVIDDGVSMVPNDGDLDAEEGITKVLEDFDEADEANGATAQEYVADDLSVGAPPVEEEDLWRSEQHLVQSDQPVGMIMGERGTMPLARGSVTGEHLIASAPKVDEIEMRGGEEVQIVVVNDTEDSSDEGINAAVFFMNDLAEALKKDKDEEINKAVLRAFFQEHGPSRLAEVDSLLMEYKGREEELFTSLNEQVEAQENEISERLRSNSTELGQKPKMKRIATTGTFLEISPQLSDDEVSQEDRENKEDDMDSMVEADTAAHHKGVRRLFPQLPHHHADASADRKDKRRTAGPADPSKGISHFASLMPRNSYRARASAKLSLAFSQFKSRESRHFEEQEVASSGGKPDTWWPIFFLLSPRAKSFIAEKKGKWWKRLFSKSKQRNPAHRARKATAGLQRGSVNRYLPRGMARDGGVGWGKNKKPPVPREVGPTVMLRDLSKVRKRSAAAERPTSDVDASLRSFAEALEPVPGTDTIRNPSTAAGAVAAAAAAAAAAVEEGEEPLEDDGVLNSQGYILSGIREGNYSRWTVNHMIKDRMAAAGVNDATIEETIVTSSEML